MNDRLTRRSLVRCPPGIVVSTLRELFDRGRSERAGDAVELRLKAPIRLRGLDADIMLRHNVTVEFDSAGRTDSGSEISIRWRPAHGEAFPRFTGSLRVEDDTAQTCWLRLDGVYERPVETLRIAESGEIAIGYRIAVATANMLLEEVVRSIESCCHA